MARRVEARARVDATCGGGPWWRSGSFLAPCAAEAARELGAPRARSGSCSSLFPSLGPCQCPKLIFPFILFCVARVRLATKSPGPAASARAAGTQRARGARAQSQLHVEPSAWSTSAVASARATRAPLSRRNQQQRPHERLGQPVLLLRRRRGRHKHRARPARPQSTRVTGGSRSARKSVVRAPAPAGPAFGSPARPLAHGAASSVRCCSRPRC